MTWDLVNLSAMEARHEKIRAQLERLVVSAEFARADRTARFLRFVLEQSLEENVEALKERQICIEVFDRPRDWDPKLDNIVRSEARRLRANLEAYAASGNPDETVRIIIPKGGYLAEFTELPAKKPALDLPDLSAASSSHTPSENRTRSQPWWRASALIASSASRRKASTLPLGDNHWQSSSPTLSAPGRSRSLSNFRNLWL